MNISMNSMIANTLFGSKSSISAGSFYLLPILEILV